MGFLSQALNQNTSLHLEKNMKYYSILFLIKVTYYTKKAPLEDVYATLH